MQDLLANPTLPLYVASLIVLGLNLMFLAAGTAITRTGASEVVNPEDQKLNSETTSVVFDAGNDTTGRFRRAHRNALENIPLFLVSGLVLVLVGASTTVAGILFGLFVFARVMHSILYIKAVQPLRTACFALGFFTQLTTFGFIAYAVFFS